MHFLHDLYFDEDLGCAARFAITIKFEFFFYVFAMPQNRITLYLSAGGYCTEIIWFRFHSLPGDQVPNKWKHKKKLCKLKLDLLWV